MSHKRQIVIHNYIVKCMDTTYLPFEFWMPALADYIYVVTLYRPEHIDLFIYI